MNEMKHTQLDADQERGGLNSLCIQTQRENEKKLWRSVEGECDVDPVTTITAAEDSREGGRKALTGF